eukprot:4515707-Prymnesium_polylepis.1
MRRARRSCRRACGSSAPAWPAARRRAVAAAVRRRRSNAAAGVTHKPRFESQRRRSGVQHPVASWLHVPHATVRTQRCKGRAVRAAVEAHLDEGREVRQLVLVRLVLGRPHAHRGE